MWREIAFGMNMGLEVALLSRQVFGPRVDGRYLYYLRKYLVIN